MTDEHTPIPDETSPTPDAGAATKSPTAWRSRRWLAGATLVTLGLAAGGGATYAFTATNNDGSRIRTSAGYGAPTGGPDGLPTGAPPGGSAGIGGPSGSMDQPT